VSLAAEVGEHGAVEVERAEEIALKLAECVLRGGFFDGAGLDVGRVVYDDVDEAVGGDDIVDGFLDLRKLVVVVKTDELDVLLFSEGLDLVRVARGS
jgi:hypothetical protein